MNGNLRAEGIKTLKENDVVVYPDGFPDSINISAVNDIADAELSTAINVSQVLLLDEEILSKTTSGRILNLRDNGKMMFMNIFDHTGNIQLAFKTGEFSFDSGKNEFCQTINIDNEELDLMKFLKKYVNVGDFIGVEGKIFKNNKGQKVLAVTKFKILSKSVRELPEKFNGIKDDSRFKEQVLWLISNEEAREKIQFRNEFVWQLRNFYHDNGFTEVETPILSNSASGAAAQPFKTHHNDFEQDFFLRIAKEPKLKMAVAAGLGPIFEVAKDFRNEGTDASHMQEFTMLEHYRPNWSNEDNKKFIISFFEYIFEKLNLNKQISIPNNNGEYKDVDFGKKWEEIDYIEGVNQASRLDITKYKEGDEHSLINDIKDKGIYFDGMDKMGLSTLIDYLYKKVLRPSILGPAIVRNYPKFMQPFARSLDDNNDIVDQFQVVINGVEVIKSYSELVDPVIQKQNFDNQSIALGRGDEEAVSSDIEFLNAMEQGMPPMAGLGMGIDRIVAMLQGSRNIRDVTLFPLTKDNQ